MRDKKGSMWFLWIGIALYILLMLAFVLHLSNVNEKGTKRCRMECKDYDAVFVDYDRGKFSAEECWCKKEREPLRIW